MMLNFLGLASSDKYFTQKTKKSNVKKKTKKKKKRRKGSTEEEEEDNEVEYSTVMVNRGRGEMPEGAEDSGGESDEHRDVNDPHAALDIDLEEWVLNNFPTPSITIGFFVIVFLFFSGLWVI